jgi:hypothetical protein
MRPRKIDGKTIVQGAVSSAGKGLADLIKVFEEHGSAITDTQFAQSLNHLCVSLSTTIERSKAVRAINKAGNFSFDDSAPKDYSEQVMSVYIEPAHADPAPRILQGGGRIDMTTATTPPMKPPAPKPPEWVKPTARLSKHAAEPNAGQAVHIPVSIPGVKQDELLDGVPDKDPDGKPNFSRSIGFMDASNDA